MKKNSTTNIVREFLPDYTRHVASAGLFSHYFPRPLGPGHRHRKQLDRRLVVHHIEV